VRYSTPWVKKGDTILLSISLLNIDRFSQFFYRRTQLEIAIKLLIKIPSRLRCVATLPCEMLETSQQNGFCALERLSASRWWFRSPCQSWDAYCTHLIFVDPGVKINGCYYREMLLSQQLLPAIRQVSGDFFVFQQDSAPAQFIWHYNRCNVCIISFLYSRDNEAMQTLNGVTSSGL